MRITGRLCLVALLAGASLLSLQQASAGWFDFFDNDDRYYDRYRYGGPYGWGGGPYGYRGPYGWGGGPYGWGGGPYGWGGGPYGWGYPGSLTQESKSTPPPPLPE